MKVKKVKKYYVTFHRVMLDGSRTKTVAIACPDKETALECATDVSSIQSVRYVRINESGRFPYEVVHATYQQYVSGEYLAL